MRKKGAPISLFLAVPVLLAVVLFFAADARAWRLTNDAYFGAGAESGAGLRADLMADPGPDPADPALGMICSPGTDYFLAPATCSPDAFAYLTEMSELAPAAPDTGPNGLPVVPVVVNDSVESFISYFQAAGRPHFTRWLGRTRGYINMVQRILREEGLPEDLFYLALIESGLNPTARSRASAVGMWQFIKPTAVRYGLRVDWWIDERRDPETATRAAANYLRDLYERFGSWYLAAAGYNTGEGRVMRAVRRHGSKDFWALSSTTRNFGRETRNYVPKYLAAMLIAKDPDAYGFTGLEYHDEITYDKVTVPTATDLRVIADAAGTTVTEIRRLNPALLRWYTPPDYPDFEVKIPAGRKEAFEHSFEKVPPSERLVFHRHRVRRGDTLRAIARRYGAPLDLLIFLNELKNPRLIHPGQLIVVPVRSGEAAVASSGPHGG